MMKLKLRWKITAATEDQAGPLLAARLEGRPFELAMNMTATRKDSVTQQDRVYKNEDCLELPAPPEERDPNPVIPNSFISNS